MTTASEGLFTSAGDAQELFCHMDAGYEPVQHVFGNVAYSIGVGGGILGSFEDPRARRNPGIQRRLQSHAPRGPRPRSRRGAPRQSQCGRRHSNDDPALGRYARNDDGRHRCLQRRPSCLRGCHQRPNGRGTLGDDEPGLRAIKLLMSTSIYSLGRTGGFLAAFKSFHTWRDQRTDAPRSRRLRNRDQSPQGRSRPTDAEDVVGVKTLRDHSGVVSFEPSGAEIQICSPPPCFCTAGASCE